MKTLLTVLLIALYLVIPIPIQESCHHAFDNFSQQQAFAWARWHHGAISTSSDLKHFTRANREVCRLVLPEGI